VVFFVVFVRLQRAISQTATDPSGLCHNPAPTHAYLSAHIFNGATFSPNCVSLSVQARKIQADGNGNESPMPLNDYIEVGVFKGKKDEEQPLYLKKVKFTQEQNTFEIVVDEMPTRAGLDPYNKLIDRVADDNLIDVTKP
jgi:hypothetical protein